jgi:hypothetical protein
MSMDYRALMVSAVLATGAVGFAPICPADIVASDEGITVRDAGIAAPARGMTMAQVASKFGDPVTKVPAVGKTPISRWEYSGFVVYFEGDHVIHAVVSTSAPAESSGAASSPTASAPAAEPAPAAVPVQAPVALVAVPVQAPVAQTSMTSTSAPAEAPTASSGAAKPGAAVPGAAAAESDPQP